MEVGCVPGNLGFFFKWESRFIGDIADISM